MALPNDQIIGEDLYGSRVRLNPLSDERSYATRLFRVRLDSEWTTGDLTSADPAPWWDSTASPAGPSEGIDKFKRAVWAAVGISPGNHPELINLPVQDITARQIGPFDFEVQAEYLPDTSLRNAIEVSTSTIQIPVYREAFDSGGAAIDSTSGLPDGNFVGRAAGVSIPANSGTLQSKLWVVPVGRVGIRGEITQTTLASLFGPGGAQTYVGYYNSAAWTIAGITFAAGTLRYDGLAGTSVTTNAAETSRISYDFTWRPTGWWSQELVPTGTGFVTTQNVNNAFPQANFNAISWPT